MKRFAKAVNRVGQKAVKFNLFVKVFKVSVPTPAARAKVPKGSQVIVELENKKRVDSTSDHDVDEEIWDDDAVQVSVTLFRDAKGKYQPKPFTLKLRNVGGKKDVLATFIVDAAQFASLGTAGAGTSSKTCTLTALPKDSPVKDLMLKVTIGCTFLRESTGDDDTSTVLTDGDDQNDAGGGGGRGAEQDLDGFDNDQRLDGFDEAAEDAYDEDEPLGKSSDGVDQDALLSEALGDAGGGGHDEEEDFDDGKIDSLLDDVDMLLAGGGSADDAQGPPPATMKSEIRENGKFPLPKSPALSSAQDTIALLQGLASEETSPSNGSSSSLRGVKRAAAAAAAELDGIEGGSGDAALGGSLSETDHAIEAEANKVRCELEQQLQLAEEEERRKQQAAVKELLGELAKLQDENAKLSTRATEAEKRAAEVASVCRALKKRAKDLEGDLDVAKEDSVAKDKLQELLAAKEVEVGGLASALVSAGVKQQAAETAKARADSRAAEAEKSRVEAEAEAESSRQQAAEAARQQRHAAAAAEVKVQEAEAEVERAKAAEAAAVRKATAAETAATERVSEMDIELEAQKTEADAKVRAAHTKAAQLEARVAEVQALASSQAGEQLGSNSAAQAAALAAASSKTGAFEEAVAVLEAHVETLKSDAAAAARKAKAALATAAARVTELEAEEDSARRTAAKDKNAAAAKATALEAQVGELEAAVRDGERALQQQQRTHAAALQQAEAKLEAAKGEGAAALEEAAARARTESAKQQAELKETLTAQAEANAKEAKATAHAETSAQNKKVGKAGGAVVDELVTSLRAQLELTTGSLSSAKAEAAELKVVAKQGLEEQGRGHAMLVQQLQQQILGLEAELDETAARGEARAAELQWKLLEMAGQNQALEDKASQDEAAKEAARSAGTQGQAALEAALETSGGAQREAEGKLQRCEELLASTRVRAEAAESSTAVAEARGAEKARQFERLAAEAGSVAAAAERCAKLEAQVESLTANASASAEAEANATAAVMAMAARAEGNAGEVAGLAFSLEMVAGKARKALRAIAKEPQGGGTGNGDGSTGAEEGSSSNGSAAAAAARAALEHLKSAQQRQQQQEEEQGASGVGFSAAAAAAGLATEAVAALADVSLRVRGEWFEASTALEERVAKGGELHAAALAAEQAVETGHASAKIHAQAKDKEVARLQEQIKRLKAEVEDVSSAAEPLELELGALRTELLEAEMAITDAVAAAKTDAAREHRELQQRAEALEAKLALAEKALQDERSNSELGDGFGSTGGGLSAVEFRVQASQALLSGNAAKLAESAKARKLLLGNSARQLEAVQAQSAAREQASRAVAPPPKRPPPEETPTPATAAPATPKEEAPATSPTAAERVQQAEASACGPSGDEVQATQGLSSNGLSGVRCTSCNTVLGLSEAASHVCGEAEARASTAEEPPPPSSTDDDVPSTRRSESRFSVSGMASYFNKT